MVKGSFVTGKFAPNDVDVVFLPGSDYPRHGSRLDIPSPKENRRIQHRGVEDTASRNIRQRKHLAMKPIALTAEQRKEIERRRKKTTGRYNAKISYYTPSLTLRV